MSSNGAMQRGLSRDDQTCDSGIDSRLLLFDDSVASWLDIVDDEDDDAEEDTDDCEPSCI